MTEPSATPTESNANLGRNTGDPSGAMPPPGDGAPPPSNPEPSGGKSGWVAFWIVIALLVLGGIVWWLVASGEDDDVDGTNSPSPLPTVSATTEPTATPSPSETPSASADPSPSAAAGEQLSSGDFEPAWPNPVPAFDGPLEPLGTGWESFYQYAASLVAYQCGDNFDSEALDTEGYIALDGAVQNSMSGPEATFALASRMTNTSDTDLTDTVWQGPEVLFIDANDKIVAVTRVESQPIDRPEFSDTPPGAFAAGDSIEVYGSHGPIRQCLSQSDDLDSGEPNPDWAPIDTQAVLAPGTYDAVIRVSQPYSDDLEVDGVTIGDNPPELLYTELGEVTITE
jgi:hypothetical protein